MSDDQGERLVQDRYQEDEANDPEPRYEQLIAQELNPMQMNSLVAKFDLMDNSVVLIVNLPTTYGFAGFGTLA